MFDRRLIAQLRQEFRELVQALRTWRFYGTLLATAVGSVAGAIAINGVLIPRNLFSPGTSGVSLLIYYLAGWPSLGVIYFLLNI
ncbi:MAG TPA: YitT family protein, partial [Longimicrobiales bacterium]|nr:YitT family protein [Longimicrobiales bacterium]